MINFRQVHWTVALFLIIYQVLTLAYAPFYFSTYSPPAGLIAVGVVMFVLCGLGITAGYHRCFSHRCYKAHPVVEALLVFLGSLGFQGSVIRWSHDHRLHHAFVDTDRDPYSISKGFLYAHMLWLFHKPNPVDPKIVSDLYAKPLLRWQHQYDTLWMIGANVLVCTAVALYFQEYWSTFYLLFCVRLFLQHHSTWFINSLAHTWGDKPFSQEHSAVNNYIISLLTFGEGYHNYHHTYSNDYRNGVRWYQFDPTKWLIWGLSRFGLAWGLKTVDECTIRKKLVLEGKRELGERIKESWHLKKDELEKMIAEIADRVVEQIAHVQELKTQYLALKKEKMGRGPLKELRGQMKAAKKRYREDWRQFRKLSREIYRLAAA